MTRLLAAVACCLIFVASARADDWPQWRGPYRDGISQETGLLQEWPSAGPPIKWMAKEIGSGYSSPSIAAGRVYVQTTHGEEEFALCLDEATGQPIWEVPIGKVGRNRGPQYPGTRSTPTVDGSLIYCLASDGELVCLEAAGGRVRWQRHMREDFDGEPGNWAYAESVLIDGDALIATPGGQSAALVALNKRDGEVIWKSAVPDGGTAEYSSIMIVDEAGPKQYVTFLRSGLVGVDAATGRFYWLYGETADQGANILTPVVRGNRVFSSGSRSGGGLVELVADGDAVAANKMYFVRQLNASIGGAVLIDGLLYGATRQALFCADFDTGEIKWTDRGVGAASLCYADGRLYLRGHDAGEIALVEPSAAAYRQQGRFLQPERSEVQAWPHPVIANGCLYIRDQEVLLCFDIRAER